MIAILGVLALGPQLVAPDYVGAEQRTQVASCVQHQNRLVELLAMLDQPQHDAASAATALAIQVDCAASAVNLMQDEWTAPCGRFLDRHAEVAAGLASIFEGRRQRDDVPGFIYPGWQDGAVTCHLITESKG